ncbi:MAG: RNA polymerase sigma-I factor [Clostridiales bacterium]|jgi:RNA polymerase sigma factor|nr:RNA polymerase sigma-I factor [Clostridiales bacterium]
MSDAISITIHQAIADSRKRELFIEAYKPFIAATVSKICGKYKIYGVDEELSIGLMAFDEAISKFDGRGSFLSFAKLVIKSRLYDYFRYQKRRAEGESLYLEDGRETQSIVDKSLDADIKAQQQLELKDEIMSFSRELAKYGITIAELVKASPKHGKKRSAVSEVIKFICSDPECMEYFKLSGNLPLKIIENKLGMSRKLIEPYRKYIIASLVIYFGKYAYLKEYLK